MEHIANYIVHSFMTVARFSSLLAPNARLLPLQNRAITALLVLKVRLDFKPPAKKVRRYLVNHSSLTTHYVRLIVCRYRY